MSKVVPVFTNENGDKLSLGTDTSEVQRIFKKPCREGWYTTYDKSVLVLNLEGSVTVLTIGNDSWKTPEGFTVGTAQKDIRAVYGEPSEVREYNPKIKLLPAADYYSLKSGNTGVFNNNSI